MKTRPRPCDHYVPDGANIVRYFNSVHHRNNTGLKLHSTIGLPKDLLARRFFSPFKRIGGARASVTREFRGCKPIKPCAPDDNNYGKISVVL